MPAPVCVRSILVAGEGGSLWDELMGFVEGPLPDEPTPEPVDYIKVGRLNDDGSYEQYGIRHSRGLNSERDTSVHFAYGDPSIVQDYLSDIAESAHRQEVARTTLEAIGFEIVEGDTATKTLWEELGGTIADA